MPDPTFNPEADNPLNDSEPRERPEPADDERPCAVCGYETCGGHGATLVFLGMLYYPSDFMLLWDDARRAGYRISLTGAPGDCRGRWCAQVTLLDGSGGSSRIGDTAWIALSRAVRDLCGGER